MIFYKYQQITDSILQSIFDNMKVVKYKKQWYFNVPCAFDIETTSFYSGEDKKACMYLWQIDLNGVCFYGRTWNEFTELINRILSIITRVNVKLIIYVQNLAYEFQFMRKWFKWSHVFAREKRKPITAEIEGGVIFKCSMFLSGYSLAKIADNLMKHSIKKLTGQLDYKQKRHSETVLTTDELEYAYNDIKIIEYYIAEEIEKNKDICHIPLTSTGYVRRYVKEQCYPKKDGNSSRKFKRTIKELTIEPEEYKLLKRAFQGGFTHCNVYYSNKTIDNVSSIDFNSSYPAVMVTEKFPMSKGELVKVHSKEQFVELCKNYCVIFDIAFTELISVDMREHILSFSKCWAVKDYQLDNGKVVYAKQLWTTMTDVDFSYFNKYYEWESFSVANVYIYKRGYLPKPLINSILKLYYDKTTLKGVQGKEYEYLHSKQLLNACYGMCVTDIAPEPILYDNDIWTTDLYTLEDQISKYNKAKQRFLFYPWGIYVTAYARRNLFMGIYEFYTDYIYSDTDSIKCINYKKHLEFVERYNKFVELKGKRMCEFYNINCKLLSPLKRTLGVWDYEGTYTKFKSLGAKRYLVQENDKYKLTVAGVNKINAINYLKKFKNPFDVFAENLVIPKEYSGKNILTYVDEEIKGSIIDYNGVKGEYNEKSYIHMEESDYEFNLGKDYAEYLMGFRISTLVKDGLE